jgi:hypothetical protein
MEGFGINFGNDNEGIIQQQRDLDIPMAIQTFNKNTVEAVKCVLGMVYKDRPYARFAALETIARVPYFSYTSVLHLYETFGWFRQKEYMQIHFAESWNEMHHLLIMEELGGNKELIDRLVAQYIAFFYYWIVVALYMLSPAVAYDLNKHVELHAQATYEEFIHEHADELRAQPAPRVARDYYQGGDMYMFDAFQYHEAFRNKQLAERQPEASAAVTARAAPGAAWSTAQERSVHDVHVAEAAPPSLSDEHIRHASEPLENSKQRQKSFSEERTDGSSATGDRYLPRRPVVDTLYDVFMNICADEAEHADTMRILQREACLRRRGGGKNG